MAGGRPPAYALVVAERKAAGGEEPDESVGASVRIEAWTPNVPYVKSMNAAGAGGAYAVYLKEREKWGATPAFYLDAGEALLKLGRQVEGRRVLLSLADLSGDDPAVLRILARRLLALGELNLAVDLFERVLRQRPEEPQSLRDLALALEARGDKTGSATDYNLALMRFDGVVRGRWIRGESDFDGIECIALLEANALIHRVGAERLKNPLDPALTKAVGCDLRIVLAWDTDLTDMDLHVKEPSGEECFYSHNRTAVGGHLSHDCTRGYGPEEYFLHKAMPGTYTVSAQFYGSQAQKALGATTLQAVAITSRFRTRLVALRGDWWKEDQGPFLAQTAENRQAVALVPHGPAAYDWVDPKTGEKALVDAEFAANLSPFAYSFYRRLPDGVLTAKDIVKFGARGLRRDIVTLIALGLAMGVLGSMGPYFMG